MPEPRPDLPDDGRPHRLESAVESVAARLLTRFGVPLMIAIIGFFLRGSLTDIKAQQVALAVQTSKQGADIAQIKSDVRDVNTRLDAQVIRNVDSNTKRIDGLEERVQKIERVVPTP